MGRIHVFSATPVVLARCLCPSLLWFWFVFFPSILLFCPPSASKANAILVLIASYPALWTVHRKRSFSLQIKAVGANGLFKDRKVPHPGRRASRQHHTYPCRSAQAPDSPHRSLVLFLLLSPGGPGASNRNLIWWDPRLRLEEGIEDNRPRSIVSCSLECINRA